MQLGVNCVYVYFNCIPQLCCFSNEEKNNCVWFLMLFYFRCHECNLILALGIFQCIIVILYISSNYPNYNDNKDSPLKESGCKNFMMLKIGKIMKRSHIFYLLKIKNLFLHCIYIIYEVRK